MGVSIAVGIIAQNKKSKKNDEHENTEDRESLSKAQKMLRGAENADGATISETDDSIKIGNFSRKYTCLNGKMCKEHIVIFDTHLDKAEWKEFCNVQVCESGGEGEEKKVEEDKKGCSTNIH